MGRFGDKVTRKNKEAKKKTRKRKKSYICALWKQGKDDTKEGTRTQTTTTTKNSKRIYVRNY